MSGLSGPSFYSLQLAVLLLLLSLTRVDAGSDQQLIIKFKGYYLPPARHTYIHAAFINKCPTINYTVLVRNNPAYHAPSDFEIVKISSPSQAEASGLISMLHHPTFHEIVWHNTAHYLHANSDALLNITSAGMQTRNTFSASVSEDAEISPPPRFLTECAVLWKEGITGKAVKIAVFDTGLNPHRSHFADQVLGVYDFTEDDFSGDSDGHGTFVAGVIAGRSTGCPGVAPDASLYIYRVFNRAKASRTTWFLDAFNHAFQSKVDIINLSIGGPDFRDKLFVDKVSEIVSSGVTFVSAIGNDGPVFGTLNNPADQMDVIGVGAYSDLQSVAQFSSRGMTTWDLLSGYGRVKPDIMAPGLKISSASLSGSCTEMHGTSVASPVVSGVLALLIQAAKDSVTHLNPGRLKQALVNTAIRLPNASMFEQGAGRLNLVSALNHLLSGSPRVTTIPTYLDQTDTSGYFWPFSRTPIYHTGMPFEVNFTVINGLGVTSRVNNYPTWKQTKSSGLVDVRFQYSPVLWPYTGYLAVTVSLTAPVNAPRTVKGLVTFLISTYVQDSNQNWDWQSSVVDIPLVFALIPTPDRSKRLLWDQFHNLRYPTGYFPRDNLHSADLQDWTGDHPHTNFRGLFNFLREKGFFVEVLTEHFSCFNATRYAVLLIFDPEDEFFATERAKFRDDVLHSQLGVVVVSNWWNSGIMESIGYLDENSRTWRLPVTGGSNVPAVNDLLRPFNISLSNHVYGGQVQIGVHKVHLASAGSVLAWPPDSGFVMRAPLILDEGHELLEKKRRAVENVPIGGLLPLPSAHSGNIAVLTDSSCLEDSKGSSHNCFSLFLEILRFVVDSELLPLINVLSKPDSYQIQANFRSEELNRIGAYSKVVKSVYPLVERQLPRCRQRTTHFTTVSGNIMNDYELDSVLRSKRVQYGPLQALDPAFVNHMARGRGAPVNKEDLRSLWRPPVDPGRDLGVTGVPVVLFAGIVFVSGCVLALVTRTLVRSRSRRFTLRRVIRVFVRRLPSFS